MFCLKETFANQYKVHSMQLSTFVITVKVLLSLLPIFVIFRTETLFSALFNRTLSTHVAQNVTS